MNPSKLVYLVPILCLLGCSTKVLHNNLLEKGERKYHTGGTFGFEFHRLVDTEKGVSIEFPGYIIGIEKSRRGLLNAGFVKHEATKDFKVRELNMDFSGKNKIIRRKTASMLNDYKATFVSTIVKFDYQTTTNNRINQSALYSAYEPANLDAGDAYMRGYKELLKLKDELRTRIKAENITHVFFYSMGWNSNQLEAVRNFNSLYGKMLDQSDKEHLGKKFKPLFVGITWPSYWILPVISFGNKAQDADEVGAVWANIFLHRILMPLRKEDQATPFKIIVIGHSFGARLTSRAVFSGDFLTDYDSTQKIDLTIGLESAFSGNRFTQISSASHEGNPYSGFRSFVKKAVYVCSRHDKAVTVDKFAPLIGKYRLYSKIQKNAGKRPQLANTFDLITVQTLMQPGYVPPKDDKILYIDGSDFIKNKAYRKGGKAHSDIYNDNVAEMTWKLVKEYTF